MDNVILSYGCADWSVLVCNDSDGTISAVATLYLVEKRRTFVHASGPTEGQACHGLLTAMEHFRTGVRVACPEHRVVAASVEVSTFLVNRIEALLSAAEETNNDRLA